MQDISLYNQNFIELFDLKVSHFQTFKTWLKSGFCHSLLDGWKKLP